MKSNVVREFLAASGAGSLAGIAYAAVLGFRATDGIAAFVGFAILAVPVGLLCADLIAFPLYRSLPVRLRRSAFVCVVAPAILFMIIGAMFVLTSGAFEGLNIAGSEVVKGGELRAAAIPWLLASQYDLALAGLFGGASFVVLRRLSARPDHLDERQLHDRTGDV